MSRMLSPRSQLSKDFEPQVALPRLSVFSAASDQSSKVSMSSTAAAVKPALFMDANEIKQRVRKSLQKPAYNVHDLYWDTGMFQVIARSPIFERLTLAIIAFNAIWIAIDTDYNDEEVLTDAHAVFQIAEHFFCAFFCCEWIIRFASFRRKRDGLHDPWFVFDSVLVLLIILETWLLTIVLAIAHDEESGGASGAFKNTSILRVARMLRLSRMARMARLLRAMPELMILVKGLAAAMRSVFFALCLLMIIVFVFAIAFTQLTFEFDKMEFREKYFDGVLKSMYTLLFRGALIDNSYYLINEIGETSIPLAVLFSTFVLISALTVMNMLIGVLCEVVSSVAAMENEEAMLAYVRSKMKPLVHELDTDGNLEISRDEFVKLVENPAAIQILHDVGVDAVGLVDYADFIFSDDVTGLEHPDLSFSDFMGVVLQLRGSNTATVKDIVDLRKFVAGSFKHFEAKLDSLISKRLRQTNRLPTMYRAGSAPMPNLLSRTSSVEQLPQKTFTRSPSSVADQMSMMGNTYSSYRTPSNPSCNGDSSEAQKQKVDLTDGVRESESPRCTLPQLPHGSLELKGESMQSLVQELEISLEDHAQQLDAIIESVRLDIACYSTMQAPQKELPISKTLPAKLLHGASRGAQTRRVESGHDVKRVQVLEHVNACANLTSSLQAQLGNIGNSLRRSAASEVSDPLPADPVGLAMSSD